MEKYLGDMLHHILVEAIENAGRPAAPRQFHSSNATGRNDTRVKNFNFNNNSDSFSNINNKIRVKYYLICAFLFCIGCSLW